MPQGTVHGPIMFTIIVNNIKAVNPLNDSSKFADDIVIIAPVYDCEVQLVIKWKIRKCGPTRIECL